MKLRDLGAWLVLLLAPAVPVFAFYLVFKQLNFVEVDGLPTGVVAAGPIAAYFVVFWLGLRLFKYVQSQSSPLSSAEEELVGTDWSFEARSQHGARDGTFSIGIDDRGRLSLSGNFKLGGRNVGAWKSTMAQCANKRLDVLYDLSESGKGSVHDSQGLLSMSAEPADPDAMSGSWFVIGDADAFGDLTCKRIKT